MIQQVQAIHLVKGLVLKTDMPVYERELMVKNDASPIIKRNLNGN